MPNVENIRQVEKLLEKLKHSKGFVLTDYRGLSVSDLGELRGKLRVGDNDYKIVKNTLLKIALKELGYPDFSELLTGPTAIAFAQQDALKLSKDLADFSKSNEKLVIKGGYIDGHKVDKEQVHAIAKLPSREELIAKMLGSLKSPLYGLASVLSGPMKGLAIAFSEIAKQKEASLKG